jgi:L-alanine-DL-glutamate epimerase-like enolase superfamily enzyme
MTSAGSSKSVIAEATAAQERGFSWFKIKTGHDVAADITLLRDVRIALGEAAHIYADPNEQYNEISYLRLAAATTEVKMAFVEEPIPWRNNPRRGEILSQAGLPLLADESAQTFGRAITEIERGPSALISLKPPRMGFAQTSFLAKMAAAHHKQPWIGSHAETDLGTLLCAHLAAGAAAFAGPAELSFYQRLDGLLLEEPLDVRDAVIHLDERPGIGREVSLERLARLRVA